MKNTKKPRNGAFYALTSGGNSLYYQNLSVESMVKNIISIFVWLAVLGAVWFVTPLLVRSSLSGGALASHLFVPVTLAPETRRQFHSDM